VPVSKLCTWNVGRTLVLLLFDVYKQSFIFVIFYVFNGFFCILIWTFFTSILWRTGDLYGQWAKPGRSTLASVHCQCSAAVYRAAVDRVSKTCHFLCSLWHLINGKSAKDPSSLIITPRWRCQVERERRPGTAHRVNVRPVDPPSLLTHYAEVYSHKMQYSRTKRD